VQEQWVCPAANKTKLQLAPGKPKGTFKVGNMKRNFWLSQPAGPSGHRGYWHGAGIADTQMTTPSHPHAQSPFQIEITICCAARIWEGKQMMTLSGLLRTTEHLLASRQSTGSILTCFSPTPSPLHLCNSVVQAQT